MLKYKTRYLSNLVLIKNIYAQEFRNELLIQNVLQQGKMGWAYSYDDVFIKSFVSSKKVDNLKASCFLGR